MLHNDDVVEVIATKRQGVVDSINSTAGVDNNWRVRFNDGREPLWLYFTNEAELKLVKCPQQDQGEPGFYPSRSIMD